MTIRPKPMKIVYSDQPLPTEVEMSIFLAGPTPRDQRVTSWRPEALKHLKARGYDGHVFVPESSNGKTYPEYEHQVSWEQQAIHRADCILFWIPRDLDTMPGFTTNIEFGDCIKRGNLVLGYPPGSPKMRYLAKTAEEQNIYPEGDLEHTCEKALKMLSAYPRVDGEVCVPGYIWENPGFQRWYKEMRAAGNRLDWAQVDWVFRIPNGMVFSFALKVHVYVANENRVKTNEYILTRSDIGAALLYCPDPDIWTQSEIVLVQEFRSPARNTTGLVLELPSGSSLSDKDMYTVALDELGEETTIEIDRKRFTFHPPRQLAATFSTHKAWLVSAELTRAELETIKALEGKLIQGETETEKTYVRVANLQDLLSLENLANEVDYSTLGMILAGMR